MSKDVLGEAKRSAPFIEDTILKYSIKHIGNIEVTRVQGNLDGNTSARLDSPRRGRLFFVEIFCGSGALSAAAIRRGCVTTPVDHRSNRRKQQAHALNLELTDPGAIAVIIGIIDKYCEMAAHDAREHSTDGQGARVHVHFPPPCGTCSRAREIPLAHGGPQPLWSETYPEGLPSLTDTGLAKVQAANALYDMVADIVTHIQDQAHLLTWSVENPTNSLMWWLPRMAALLDEPSAYGQFSKFHVCFCGLDSGNLKFETVRANSQHICF